MFTEAFTTPTRLEAATELLAELKDNPAPRNVLEQLLQRQASNDGKRQHAAAIFDALLELTIAKGDKSGQMELAAGSDHSARGLLLEALDRHVLGGLLDVEPYFAPFYSYVLGRGAEGAVARKQRDWAEAFNNDAPELAGTSNRLNATKIRGIRRWLSYAGLGWFDPAEVFQANPYERIQRRLGTIFGKKKKLSGDDFMAALADACPELDGGAIFLKANKDYRSGVRTCTLGLAHALVDLHGDGVIVLHCPRDSAGWSIEACNPPLSTGDLESTRIETVSLPDTQRKH